MKPLAIWAPAVAAVFGLFAIVTSATSETEQVYVVVDSSFQMRPVWSRVPDELDRIDARSRAEFALANEKAPIHGYEPQLTLAAVDVPFAPCDFEGIADTPDAMAADERILITVAGNECPTDDLVGWTIVEL